MISEKMYSIILLFFILILASILRFQYLNKPLQRDEVVFYESAINLNTKGVPIFCEKCLDLHGRMITIFNYHTQLFLAFFKYIVYFFNLNEIMLRFSITIFSLATVVLTYFLGKEIGGEKLGLLSSFFLATNRLHIEHSQIIDIDGSFLTFFIILSVFFLLKWLKKIEKKYFIFSLICFILSILAKETAVLIFLPLFLCLHEKKNINKFLEFLTIVISISLMFIFIFNYVYSSNFFDGVLQQINRVIAGKSISERVIRLYQFAGITTWNFTPPFILIGLFSTIYTRKDKNLNLKFLLYIVLSFVFFYTIVLGVTRYFVPINPIVCLLISNYILNSKIKCKKKNLVLIFSVTILCILGFYFLRMRTDFYFLNEARTNFSLIIIPYILCLIPLVFYLKRDKTLALIMLIGMTIGYNIYFAQEIVNPLVTPNYHKAIVDAAEFIRNSSTKGPIITTEDIAFYTKKEYYNIKRLNRESIDKITKEGIKLAVYKTDDIVIQQDVKDFLEKNCKKIENGFSAGVEVFKVFIC